MEQKIIKIIYFEFKKQNGFDLPVYEEASSIRIKEASLKAIEKLKTNERVEINLPFITANSQGPKHLSFSISEKEINEYRFDNNNNFKDGKVNKKSSIIKKEKKHQNASNANKGTF